MAELMLLLGVRLEDKVVQIGMKLNAFRETSPHTEGKRFLGGN